MAVRNIIRIDESKCNGCGNCITDCAENALAIIDGKARLIRESYCDGLGACLAACPTGALTIERREADEFDEAAVAAAQAAHARPAVHAHAHAAACPSSAPMHGGGCPGSMSRRFGGTPAPVPVSTPGAVPSQLTAWPIQLHLVHPLAPQFQGANLLIAADCTAFALGAFHAELLAGRALAIACPKLDDDEGYVEKLAAIFAECNLASVTVARMEVPCCGGLVRLVLDARDRAESSLPVEEVVVGVEGGIIGNRTH